MAQKKSEEMIKFKEMTYNFGKIKQGVPVTHDFEFTNISGEPVVIESATASCGCTTPTWPKAPVTKDKGDKITAGFNAAAIGSFNKSITIKVAGSSTPVQVIITGEVLNADDYAKYEKSKSN
jgi:hypothetical protein